MPTLAFLFFILFTGQIFAVPAPPGWLDVQASDSSFRIQLKGDEFFSWAVSEEGYRLMANSAGQWCFAEKLATGALVARADLYNSDTHPHYASTADPDPAWILSQTQADRARRDAQSRLLRTERVEGQWNLLLIMIEFPDMDHQVAPENFEAMMNEEDYQGTGSFRDYYEDLSYGRYSTTASVTSWFQATENHDYYGYSQGWSVAQQLVREAIIAADADVDFSQFDNDQDGRVDALLIVHAGAGAEEGNQTNIWSHRWSLWDQELELDGVMLSDYTIQPEMQNQSQAAIGVYVHEFGHNLGLPDLYDTDYSSSGVGTWCVMSGGSWGGPMGGGAHTPVRFSAWCRKELGWATPYEVLGEMPAHSLAACTTNDSLLSITHPDAPDQSFLFECRPKVGWDQHLAGEGLLIYHIDDNQGGNSNEAQFLVDVEQADGLRDLNQGYGADGGDPFPGSSMNTDFDESTSPSSLYYGLDGSPVAIRNISLSANADTAYADFFQYFPHQQLQFSAWHIINESGGDGWPHAGETVQFSLAAVNMGAPLELVEFEVQPDPSRYEILDAHSMVFNLEEDEAFNTDADPFEIRFHSDLPPEQFILHLSTVDAGAWPAELSGRFTLGRADLLLLDDQSDASHAAYLSQSLAELNQSVELREIAAGMVPDDLEAYAQVLWSCGAEEDPLSWGEWQALHSYVEGGGQALLTAQKVLIPANQEALADFSVGLWGSVDGNPRLLGEDEGGLFEDNEQFLLFGGLGAWNQEMPTLSMACLDDARPLLHWPEGQSAACSKQWESEGRFILCAFSVEAIHGVGSMLNRAQVLDRLLTWLETGQDTGLRDANSRPQEMHLSLSPNPFNPTSTVHFQLTEPVSSAQFSVYNLLGAEVFSKTLKAMPRGSHSIELNLQNQATGLYLLLLERPGQPPMMGRALMLK
jgi:M6 family metalloprotease-like protein